MKLERDSSPMCNFAPIDHFKGPLLIFQIFRKFPGTLVPQNSENRRQCAYSLRNLLRRLRRGFRKSKKSDSKNVNAARVNFFRKRIALKTRGTVNDAAAAAADAE